MKIIISPAKKMNTDTDSLPWRDLPKFLPEAKELCGYLREMDYDTLKKLWKCNDQIATLNYERLEHMDLTSNLTPAILAYEGIQYQYMAPTVFTEGEYEYIQSHLRILSGLYGVLKPFDGITPYRLEMQAKLNTCNVKDLYTYWGSKIAEELCKDTDCIVNLASKEYSACVSKHLPPDVQFITCVFAEENCGKLIEKGTMCKMARGEMVRYMAENQVTDPAKLQSFQRLDYVFDESQSNDHTLVFIRN